jgi:hypothetical protein
MVLGEHVGSELVKLMCLRPQHRFVDERSSHASLSPVWAHTEPRLRGARIIERERELADDFIPRHSHKVDGAPRFESPRSLSIRCSTPSSGEASASGSIEAISRAIASMSTAVPWRTLNGFIGARPYVHRSPLIKSPHLHLSNWIDCAGPSRAVARIVLART